MTDSQDPTADSALPDADPPRPSRWRRAAAAVGRVARAPFDGAGVLYRVGQENLHFTLPVLNGAFGDQLAARQDRRAIQMSFRQYGADVPLADLNLRPTASGRPRKTVVFLHGLMGDEVIWQSGSGADDRRFGPRLQRELDVCCLYLRYNSGLHISDNGRQLHALLTALVTTYPDAVGELVLVGHSMGGLVIRSAGHYGSQVAESRGNNAQDSAFAAPDFQPVSTAQKAPSPTTTKPAAAKKPRKQKPQPPAQQPPNWLEHLRDVFLLGVPNDGSFLEQNSHLTSLVLRKINLWPTRAISGLIDQRSNGIKDLRHARLTDEDWQNEHADDLFPPRTVVPPLPGVRYHILVGSLLKSASSALHDYFGDGLVGAGSASGRIFQDPAAPPELLISTHIYSKLHHGTLLSSPEVYQYLRERIGE